MQSNHDFGVAATFSVNAHGWPVPYGPFGSTVRVAPPDARLRASVVTCSPTENAELFALAMGGYGLFGVIVDLEVAMVENVLLRPTYELMPASQLGPRFGGEPGAGRHDPDGVRAPGGGRRALPPRGAARHAPARAGRAAAGDVGRRSS